MTDPILEAQACPLVIVRGPPGSGKTTFAYTHFPSHIAISADDYFTTEDGSYYFDPQYIRDAHRRCRFLTEKALASGKKVIVHNTFVKMWEVKNYLDLYPQARIFRGYGAFDSVHNVPLEKVEQMRDNMVDIEGEIPFNTGSY